MPYLQPNSPGFLTTDDILRRAQMSRAGTEYLQQLSQATTAARDEALRQARQRDSDLYIKQHFPQFAAPGTVVNAPFASGRRRSYGGRGHGGAYYEAPNSYTPTVVATGSPVYAAPQPSNMAVISPREIGFTGPRTVEEVRYDQLMAGTAPESLTYPGYMPVSHGFMYSGTKEGFYGAPDEE